MSAADFQPGAPYWSPERLARAAAPLGGKAHPHQIIVCPAWRPAQPPRARKVSRVAPGDPSPRYRKARAERRAITAGGGLWWRLAVERANMRRAARARAR